ncbi:PE family protein [Mycobacteroides sp. LB1]|uniref:PE family protein n=1 Tax=Mycobacteroides sp. LB1 TaxID=2750814 RepID=UPI0015DD626E|nr:PE family protein [Mycobacteroides sp. LB1]
MSNSGLSINVGEVAEAAKQLDALADRLQKTMQDEDSNLNVIAPGRDEVSVRAAATMNEVKASFGKSNQQGLNELREIAATLRSHGNASAAVDSAF